MPILAQQLVARRHRLRLERLGRRRRRHLRRHQPREQLVLGHRVHHRELPAVVDGDVDLAEVLARLLAAALVVHVAQLDAAPTARARTTRSNRCARRRRARRRPRRCRAAARRAPDRACRRSCRAAATSTRRLSSTCPLTANSAPVSNVRVWIFCARHFANSACSASVSDGANDATTLCVTTRPGLPSTMRTVQVAPPRTSGPPSPSGRTRIAARPSASPTGDAPSRAPSRSAARRASRRTGSSRRRAACRRRSARPPTRSQPPTRGRRARTRFTRAARAWRCS